MKKKININYNNIIAENNLLSAWQEFLVGKKKKKDVQIFQANLMSNIFSLHNELKNFKYSHGGYIDFHITDPKLRHIHKASVKDRLLHHAIYRQLYPFFDKTFIHDSYSCRVNKGTHRAINRLREMQYKVSKNNTKTCWVLKCDIKRFFDSIDHKVLQFILKEYIEDKEINKLLKNIIESFHTKGRKGLPLGNLTSQLFVNIYMNKFDQYVKHKLKAKYYIRYADDFVVLSESKSKLESVLIQMKEFLSNELKLEMHPNKISITTINSGVDFLGWVNFSKHRTLRTETKNRMFKKIRKSDKEEVLQSYLGLLSYGDAFRLREAIKYTQILG